MSMYLGEMCYDETLYYFDTVLIIVPIYPLTIGSPYFLALR
jgi:hypothetical protein